jgi:hypothetical protein
VLGDGLPQAVEDAGAAGEMDAGEIAVGQRDLRDLAGIASTVLPISAGAVERLPPMALKLNGVMA